MTPDLERTLCAHGAVLGAVHGVTLPLHFGDVGREWRAAREGAGVCAAGFRALVAATGDDRAEFLQGMLSNDVKRLTPGQGLYAAFLTQQGKVVSDLRLYALADRMLLDVLAWRQAVLQETLEKFIVADDVELAAAEEQPLVALEGPLARTIAGQALGITDPPNTAYAQARVAFEGHAALLVAASEVEREGMLICGSPAIAPALFAACLEAGARPLGMEALEILRVENGVPWAGIDMDETTLLMETGREAAVSFTKGCYLGQETVERVAARGHVNRQLAGVIVEGDVVPSPRTRILSGEQEVGYVTSAVRSPAIDGVIALAMLQRKHAVPGSRLSVETGGSGTPATVAALPFAPYAPH